MAAGKRAPGHCLASPCDCGAAPTCTVDVTVKGCNAQVLSGAVVKIWTDSSKTTLLGSGTTDGSGFVSIGIAATPTWYWESSHPTGRLATESGTTSCSGGYKALAVSMTTASAGYHCSLFCALPLADTLHYSDPFNGAVTLTWVSPGAWSGSTTTNFPGCTNPPDPSTCVAQPGIPVIVTLSSALAVQFPRGFGGGCASCAAPGGPTPICTGPRITTVCPPSLYVEGSFRAFNVNPCASAFDPDIIGTVTE